MVTKLTVVFAAIMLSLGAAPAGAAPPGHSLRLGSHGAAVASVQQVLRGYGYVLATDGDFDARTDVVVRSWQRANGLTADGVVGPVTLDSLMGTAISDVPAVRLDPPVPQPEPRVPVAIGLHGMPAAPAGLSDQATFQFYRVQAGLPARFDALGRRESRWTNTPISRTGCCRGALQIHQNTFRDHRMIPLIEAHCNGATWADIGSDTPFSWQLQMCVAAQLYAVRGYAPWRL